ncbi:MAG: hypothetical protein KTR31_29045 [Myxococcales bacterium]|nr:hypothetical protein [Myxococcales bacterium]
MTGRESGHDGDAWDSGLVFVLSAGRTGTVFLTQTLPRHVGQLHCVHEPMGSRSLLMAANLRNLWGVGDGWVRDRFRSGLRRRLEAVPAGHRYVEVNPMMCALTDELAQLPALSVVHLVREPTSWVRSIRAFRASGVRRHLIDHTPLANPYPAPRPPGWLLTSQVERALWRWRFCNEQIEALAPHCARYVRLRHEDLFSGSRDARSAALLTLLDVLQRPAPADLTPLLQAPPANRAPSRRPVTIDPARVAEICGPVARRMGYAPPAVLPT